MGEKVARYAIKVDLDCEKCRKKIKKVLCKIPQIQDQQYDEKNNIVVVKVVCCNPDKVKKKICCNGGKVVKGIELVKPPPPPPKPKEKDSSAPPAPPKSKDAAGPPPPPKPDKAAPPKPDKPKDDPPKKKDDDKPKPPPPKRDPEPPQIVGPVLVPPMGGGTCCRECYEGRGGGPCWALYGRPCYSNNQGGYVYGRPVYDSWGGGSYVQATSFYGGGGSSTCADYIRDDNPNGCSIM